MVDAAYSQQTPSDSASEFGLLKFHIDQRLARVRTVTLVLVTAVNGGDGAIAAPTTVSVMPLVKIIDGQGNVSSHGIVNNIPVWRLSSALGAVIVDPKAGEIGLLAVCDRDISSVKANKAEAQPGSRRKFDLADGVYLGSLFGGAPEQYVAFTENGIKIADKNGNAIELKQGGIFITGNLVVQGNLQLSGNIQNLDGNTYAGTIKTTGDVVAGNDNISLQNHHHLANGQPTGPALP